MSHHNTFILIIISQYVALIFCICVFILVRIFLLILRYLFYYLRSFYPHISDIVCLYFRTHLNMILHTYLSIYYVFVFVSFTWMYMLYFFFTSHFIHTHLIYFYTHISFILSKPFLQYLYCIRLRFTHIWF